MVVPLTGFMSIQTFHWNKPCIWTLLPLETLTRDHFHLLKSKCSIKRENKIRAHGWSWKTWHIADLTRNHVNICLPVSGMLTALTVLPRYFFMYRRAGTILAVCFVLFFIPLGIFLISSCKPMWKVEWCREVPHLDRLHWQRSRLRYLSLPDRRRILRNIPAGVPNPVDKRSKQEGITVVTSCCDQTRVYENSSLGQ